MTPELLIDDREFLTPLYSTVQPIAKWDASQHPRDAEGQFTKSTYVPDHDAPEKGEFDWTGVDRNAMFGPGPKWRQQHKALVKDALQSWVGDPGNFHIHAQDAIEGAPIPGSGSGKEMRAQAEALLWELNNNPKTTPELYRGSGPKGDAPGLSRAYSWSEDRKTAEIFAKRYGGTVEVLPAGSKGLRLRDYTGDAFGEKQWVVRAGNDPVKKFDEPKYSYGNTQIAVSPHSSAALVLNMTRDRIPDEHLMAAGKDVDPNHVTVRYGLLNDNLDELRSFIAHQTPFEAQLGAIELFDASEHSDGAVPVVARIYAPELHAIEAEIGKYAEFKDKNFPEYKPHCTLAYCTPEDAPTYGDLFLYGSFLVQSITISHQSGVQETIPFGMTQKWDAAKHPRKPSGSGEGGEFAESGTAVTLYRGDSESLSPALSYSDPNALFGAGIYLTDSKRIAGDYKAKGGAEGEIFRYGGGPKNTKQDAIDAYIRGQARFVDAKGKSLQYPTQLHGYVGTDTDSPEWNRKAKEDEDRMAHAKKQWEDIKDTMEVRKLADNTIVIQKKGQTGHLSEYAIPKDWIKKTLDAEAPISRDVAAALYGLMRKESPKLADEIYHKATTEDEDGFLPSFRDIYREAAGDRLLNTGLDTEEGQTKFRKALKELGFKGIKYAGGITMGGAKHTAYVFWDEQGLKKVRRKREFDPAKHPRNPGGSSHGGEFTDTLHGPKDAMESLLNGEKATIDRDDVLKLLELASEQLEDPNLMNLHVEGMRIFDRGNLNIERDLMPQIPKEHRDQFVKWMKEQGVTATLELANPLDLLPTQNAVSARNAGEKIKKYEKDKKRPFFPVMITKENRIVDGHHHWAMMAALAIDHPNIKMPILRFNVGINKALALAKTYMKIHKLERKSLSGATVKFDESKHPRDKEGQFVRGWHLTADPHFVPDPKFKPELNSIGGDLLGENRPAGIFVGDPEFWMHAHGYERPYVAEIEGKQGPSGITMYGPSRENFLQDAKTIRVLTADEYARETFGERGWVESYFDPKSYHKIPKMPKGYVGRPVSDMTSEELHEWERKFAEYAGRPDGPNPKVTKADPVTGRYVTPFVSFDKQGDDALRMIASLNSSRLATWGFTAEAEVLGMARYKLTAVLDGRTSKFCRMIDGKVFEVSDARRKVIEALNVQDPEDLRTVQPWPKQSKADMAMYAEMSNEEFVERGLHIPPFHPYCRTLLRHVESSQGEAGESVATVPEGVETFHAVTAADLKELGIDATPEDVAAWNESIGMTPVEMLSKLTGMTPQDVMTKGKGVGANPINFDANNIGIKAHGENTNGVEFKLGAILDPFTGIFYLTQADLLAGTPKAELAFLKNLFSELISAGTKTTATTLAVGAAGNAAYYAKLGFLPDDVEWDSLRTYALTEIETGALKDAVGSLAPADQLLVKQLLQDKSSSALSALVELPFYYRGRSIGEWILEESAGTWALDLTDEVLVSQAKAYLS